MGGNKKAREKNKTVPPPPPPPPPPLPKEEEDRLDLASEEDSADDNQSNSVYDSEDGLEFEQQISEDEEEDDDDDDGDDDDGDDDDGDDSDSSEDDEEEEFEDQGSSDDDDDRLERQQQEDDDDANDNVDVLYEEVPRTWKKSSANRKKRNPDGTVATGLVDTDPHKNGDESRWIHTDDLSSDDEDEDGTGNRIGRVPLHWYDEFDHVGYDAFGKTVMKSASADRLDQAMAMQDNRAQGKFVVHDMLNDKNVELTPRQLELIRRVQAGAYAHPEHDGNPDYIDYFSGVDPEISGISSNRYEPKARFQPSRWEKLQVQRLLEKLEKGEVSMDYLKGKVHDMRKQADPKKLFILWKGDEEDEIAMRKGPTHIAAPKLPPPGHAESYLPPEEYLPTEEEKKEWAEMEPKDRPYGLLVPKKFPNLRSVGAYEHSVREVFERCLDLYLCPRALKRRLNIDPESLVPQLPKSSDLKPFPNAKCVEYVTPPNEEAVVPVIRCLAASPDGQYLASGASDGYVRLWEVETARLLRSWNVSSLAQSLEEAHGATASGAPIPPKPVVYLDWNPNRSHHCLLAAVGKCVVVIATGTASKDDVELTEALLTVASKGGNVTNAKAKKVVQWKALPSSWSSNSTFSLAKSCSLEGPICALKMNYDVSNVRWQAKGDYFISVCPKAASAAVLIHQMSKGNSQQPFSKAKGEAQMACFHPSKPFLFVASQQHVRVYHLVKQSMVKRLVSGCRWISSLDIHPSGDHLIAGSLDRRMVWFDLDLGATPYKTLKYHERALRCCRYHHRYPLMASASDDGAVHVFHSMVYSDLMRNPLIVPVKILRGHAIKDKLGVLSIAFHPTQPWIFSAGADGKIFLFQDI